MLRRLTALPASRGEAVFAILATSLIRCAMPKPLPLTDFRSRRTVLVRSDFGYAPKPAPRPSDIIDEETWDSIVTLPDDVAVRTTNYHGTTIRQLHDLWGAWIECVGEKQDCMFPVMLEAGDDFQAATYTALTGFYRLSVAALRSALELTTIGTWSQFCEKQKEFLSWRAEKSPFSFGQACDGLSGARTSLGAHLRATVNDSLFDQRNPTEEGGFARRIYSGISEFSHSRPGHADSDMRESNGPIYVASAFKHVAWMQFETIGLCFVLLLIARPKQCLPEVAVELFNDVKRVRSKVTRAAFQFVYPVAGQ
jgi:hypothetical protein